MKRTFTTIIVLLLVLSMLFGCAIDTVIESETTEVGSGMTKVGFAPQLSSFTVFNPIKETTKVEQTTIELDDDDGATIFTENGVSLRVQRLADKLNNLIVVGETTYSEICTFMQREGTHPGDSTRSYYWSFGAEGKIQVWFGLVVEEVFGVLRPIDYRASGKAATRSAEPTDIDNRPSNDEDSSSNVDPNIVFTEKGVSTRVEALAAQITIGQTRDEVYNFFGNSGKKFVEKKRTWDFGQEGKIMILFAQKLDENGKVYGDYLVAEVKTFPQYAWS